MTRRTFLWSSLGVSAAAIAAEDSRAVIVVTGMRVRNGSDGETRDLTVAEGATVTVNPKKGAAMSRTTSPMAREGRRPGTFFTADFPVALDGVYDIAMKFKDGTEIRIADYRLPPEWKTHFLFHNTRGTKSPASVLRRQTDTKSGLTCAVYALWPVATYESLTARKVEPR
jgi:hypothetical protein